MEDEDKLYLKLKEFCNINNQFRIAFELFAKDKTLSTSNKNLTYLKYIVTELLHIPQFFQGIIEHFSEELPRLLNVLFCSNNSSDWNSSRHVLTCLVISKLVKSREDLSNVVISYFEKNPSPFEENETVKIKKRKLKKTMELTDLHIVESVFHILKSNPDFYRMKWSWNMFIKKFYGHSDAKVVWMCCQVLAIVFGMSEKQLDKLIGSRIKKQLAIKYLCTLELKHTLTDNDTEKVTLDQNPMAVTPQIKENVVNICGIYIPCVNVCAAQENLLLEVPSTISNLRKLALGLSSNKAICLQGPVGSGKTSLVEHLAVKTGRLVGQNFVKIQLGDQTDSKMLLGTYRCTDIPGEFVWQPGVLTQAVVEGNWLLLEDIDSASMDIASVLTSLLENRCLTVPGYKDSVPVSPNFQLFVTQRLVTTITGHHKKHSNAIALLEKNLLQINIDPLSVSDLTTILNTRYPSFSTITDRMINVFFLFSKDQSNTNIVTIPKTGRLISTRDFFKWCARAIIDFDVSSQTSALKVLQDAIDIFCCSYTNSAEALELAKEISTNLGIINQKAEYFLNLYKPEMRLTPNSLVAGRAVMKREINMYSRQIKFSFTRPSAVLLERIMCCINLQEPVLLVGETGTGKTSSIQYLANTIGQKLLVINMNQQSDSADLLGGYKPVELKHIIAPIRKEFESIFCNYFNIESNKKYLSNITLCFNKGRWNDLIRLMFASYDAAIKRLYSAIDESTKQNNLDKLRKEENFLKQWKCVGEKLEKLKVQLKQQNSLAFAFIEGSLVKAVEKGYWVLLDEINLANAETLECLSGLLEGPKGSLCLLERGDKQPVRRHPNFILFACMNPSTDIGKKDLPPGLRNRFTEFYVDELTEKTDLLQLVNNYLEAMSLKDKDLNKIVDFYLLVRKETILTLSDGLGHKPHYSLRSLCRSLMIASTNPCGVFKRSLFEAFCLGFLSQLDSNSYNIVEELLTKYLLGDQKSVKSILKQPIPMPQDDESYLNFEGYWVHKGLLKSKIPDDYILTDSVRRNLRDIVRVVSIGKLPVLLQGDTSVGKTSLIMYLAKSSGNKCVRINNHEHTDLQEYIGSYVADASGKLVFREGLLVEAMRKGHWIILDELNLAPTDVLEALNRVLDDNRELFIPETQETVKANPNFMLFATQNPPGAYGGRKMLSRAFRNRFVELHFNEIPSSELEFILHKRCQMPPSYAKKMINVMTELQMRRKGSAAFAGKQGFMTLRDLFRWGERYRLASKSENLYDWDQHLADEGYLVLAGRVRKSDEKKEIIEVLQKHLKRQVSTGQLFTLSDKTSSVTKHILEKIEKNKFKNKNIVWTFNMRQLAVLVAKALEFKEPVLLVGETGGGKTTVCQLIADNDKQQLFTINCHMHTESSDFIGGLRPVRDHSEDSNRLFEWVDGPLIQAMMEGSLFLADEISLADDSVLERLNSLLEPERSLLLAEKGIDLNNPENSELLVAHPNFHFIGTMNPGGDFGKKELSPALRNRFTEIWCESCTDRDDLILIIEQNVKPGLSFGNQQDGTTGIGNNIMNFVEWFQRTEIGKRFTLSIRDILTWVSFINTCASAIDISEAYLHGACLTFLDSLGSGVTSTENLHFLNKFRSDCEVFLTNQVKLITNSESTLLGKLKVYVDEKQFGIKPFFIESGMHKTKAESFSFNAPTTVFNTLRLIRGMQLNKAILLEGSPGVGKTSLVTALAKYTGHRIFRINLSDQTDISDLFGADLPIEGGVGGQFSWRDGPLLQALKQGDWVLLDELNLASQSVLEGLNACLDHRGEVFIPELGKTFYIKPGTRFFACQNPLKQGGSRRGLPKSFLNRFIQVHVNSLTESDLKHILENQFTEVPKEIITKMLKFNSRIVSDLESYKFGHKGAPWECNLRDLTRWCEVMLFNYNNDTRETRKYEPERVVHLVYGDRMRTASDKNRVEEIFREIFACEEQGLNPVVYVNKDCVYIGDVFIHRDVDSVNFNVLKQDKTCLVLRSQLCTLRSLAYCVNLKWMSILVGSSGSGKTSVVKTLANLSGKTLKTLPVTSAMDTTDILGGFEQTDYSRHLDEIIKETEKLLYETLQELLINKGTPDALELLDIWEYFKKLMDDHHPQTMEEDAKLFVRKIDKLEILWNKIKSLSSGKNSDVLASLKRKGQNMSKMVEQEGSLNAGGKFEWVDSILTKCLQDGSWLLIDNVNLCSAAVLDRLNALLEPNGVLTITERGVDSNGQMVQIQPHKDFRLFLTMDPKNGEISRAMRNRGIEICMIPDEEHSNGNTLDLKSLINLQGLTRPDWIKVLIKSHDFICDLILGEKPTINEILQASFLLSKQLHYGLVNVSDTIVEVYYKPRSSIEFNCINADDVIRNEVDKYLNECEAICVDYNDYTCMYTENSTLKTTELQSTSDLAKIKQQSALIEYIIGNDNCDKNKLKYLLSIAYSITSMEDFEMRHFYIQNLLETHPEFLGLIKKFATIYRDLAINVNNLPVDNNWIPDIIQNSKNCLFANDVSLHQYLCIQFDNENNVTSNKIKDKNILSLYDYMVEKDKRNIEDKFNNVVVNEFLNLLNQFDEQIKYIPLKQLNIPDENVIQLFYLLTWRFLFYQSTLRNIKKVSPNEINDIITNLTVHYKWFYKYSVKKIFDLIKTDIPLNLTNITNKINAGLDDDFGKLNKVGKIFQNHNQRPPPLTNQHQLDVLPIFNEITQQLNLCDRKNDTVKILSIFKYHKDLFNLLIDLKVELNFDFTDASKKITLLQALFDKYKEEPTVEIPIFDIEILPVQDYFAQLELRNVVVGNSNDVDVIRTNILMPTDLIGSLLKLLSSSDKRQHHETKRLYTTYLMNSASIKPGKYLNLQNMNLNGFSPFITFYYNHLLVNQGCITSLGNFRELSMQHRILGNMLWNNMVQLSEDNYDFLNSTSHYISKEVIQFLDEFEHLLNLSDLKGPGKQLQIYLVRCRKNVDNLNKVTGVNNKIQILSDLFVELNYSQAILNSVLPLIDPLAKKALKKKYCLEAILLFNDIKQVYELESELFLGRKELHSYQKPITNLLECLGSKSDELGKYVAVRPNDVYYESIRKVINHSFATILSMDYVNKLLKDLNASINSFLDVDKNIDVPHARKTVQQCETSLISYENLLYEWTQFKSGYPDIMEPLLCNVTQFLYGLHLKNSLLKKLIQENENVCIQENLENLIIMPSLHEKQISYGEQIKKYSNAEFQNFLFFTLQDENNSHILKQEKLRLLKCGIQESFNNCIINAKSTNVLDANSFMNFHKFLDTFVAAWNKQQEDRDAKQQESESLYKTKTKCDDKSEEEQTEEELRELFPSHHDQDFMDFQKSDMSDDVEKKENKTDFINLIKHEDLTFVLALHKSLIFNFVKTEWLSPSADKNVNSDFLHPLLEKFKVFKLLMDKQIDCLDYTMDNKLLGSLSVLLSVVRQYGEPNNFGEQLSPSKIINKNTYDFYKDSNVTEIKSSCHILEELKIRINQLLDEWPEQPTLKSIITIIDRIYAFDITSPVSRFLTGFEILLSKCHEWEEVAHSGVSVSQYSQNITQQIITWRKLELSMWKDLLNKTHERLSDAVSKWWLYMYNIMEQFIVQNKFTTEELITTLQKFMNNSNIAEFDGRLELLYVFHGHAVYLEKTDQSQEFINILWNLYSYYSQFTTIVQNKIKDLRSPIEKKLKEYVKIVRWKDINYWSVKETVEKSHRTLHKFIREFKDVLMQPVLAYLVNSENGGSIENVGIWDRPQRQSPKTYHYTLDVDSYVAKQFLSKKISETKIEDEGVLGKIDAYFTKSRKLCRETILSTKYPILIQNLDGFVADIIERNSQLQNLEVDTTLPKPKQKSQAKSILQQKHRALADLFKSLTKLGLSYRTGIIQKKLKTLTSDFTMKPIDLNANFNHINYGRKEEKLLTIWDSCELYYVKSLLRSDILETALQNPSKDLGIQNIERCKGFSSHLLILTQKQKEELTKSTRSYYYLKYYFKQLNEFCESKDFVPKTKIDQLKSLLVNITIVTAQYKIILNTCPENQFGDDPVESPILKLKSKSSVVFKHDELWTKIMGLFNEVASVTTKLLNTINKTVGYVPSTEYNLISPSFICISDFPSVLNELDTMLSKIEHIIGLLQGVPMSNSLSWLSMQIKKIKDDLLKNELADNIDPQTTTHLIENFSENLLIVIQNMYKKYKTDAMKPQIEETDNSEQLEEDHIKKLLIEDIHEDFAALEIKRILKCAHKVASTLCTANPSKTSNLRNSMKQCLPLLEQVVLLYQYFITQQVSAYRVTCKLNSILLNIFIELVTKGFCIPPELSDDMDNEGISKPSDGLGLGEGEGERDVSDKIESEDQLDDAQPAGKEKEKDEDKDCKEEEKGIEMSEDFDSKLQDKEKAEDEDQSNSDSDANEQMGETEKGADQLDKEVWGSDKEDEPEDDEGESDAKEEKGNKGQDEGENQLSAKEEAAKKPEDQEDTNQEESTEKEKSKKDINEMEEPEYDDDQTDPYHGNQPELPEPEPMDLPDDLQLDEGQENENETPEENPFDIDTMKEQNVPENQDEDNAEKENDEDKPNDEAKDFSSDDEDIEKKDDNNQDDIPEKNEDEEVKEQEKESQEQEQESMENIEENKDDVDIKDDNDQSAPDQTQTNEENVEAMDVDESQALDKVQTNKAENQKSDQPIDELCQEDNPDKDGIGQSQMEESKTGHSAQTTNSKETQQLKREREDEDPQQKQKPGESDNQRSLGDTKEQVRKKLKTIDATDDQGDDHDEEEMQEVDMYQHIKDAKESSTQVLDAATEEQAEMQEKDIQKPDGEDDPFSESQDVLPDETKEDDEDLADVKSQKPDKMEGKKDNKSKHKQHPEGEVMEDLQDIEVEGEVIETSTVLRSAETTHHTQLTNVDAGTTERLSAIEINALRTDVENQLSSWNEPPSHLEAEQTWQKISSVTSSLAQDLSEQLRLILEPTQASRLKGDFRTGRRINMRKVIPYIASQFRKDKIWLRRTKPSKREYQIVLAIDDSSSMADNKSKEIAFESVALISKALTLLESGQLSVLSFGENTEIIHKLSDQFTEKSGVKLLQRFRFDQNKTCVAKLVDFSTEMFNQSQMQTTALNAKLLVIVSDGRGVFSEGETYVRQAVRRAKLANIFTVFVIVDNPENKNSILDIRMPVFKDGKLLGIQNYLDVFPFSFYIILREIKSLPNVLSDALRQWFEVVSNLDKQ